MKFTREEMHLLKIALENLRDNVSNMVVTGKELNDEYCVKIFTKEIKDIDNLMTKIINALYD